MRVREITPAKVTGIGGFFIKSRDPGRLRAWYRDHLGVGGTADRAVWDQAAGPTVFAPFAQNTTYFGRESQAFMLNFRVTDLDAMIAQLEAAGIKVETRPEEWDGAIGRFARIHDPEGNPIELWEPSAP